MNKQVCRKCGEVISNDFNETLSFCTNCGASVNLSPTADNTLSLNKSETLYSPTPQNYNAKSGGKGLHYLFGCLGLIIGGAILSGIGFYGYYLWSAKKTEETGKIVAPTSQTVRFIVNESESLDPQLYSEAIVRNALFDGLAENNKNSDLTPSLAEKWERNADATVWTFYLRKDAKWSDGKPITANDFVYSWKRILTPDEKFSGYLLFNIKNAELYSSKKAKAEDIGVRAVDDYTLEATMEKPAPYFYKLIALTAFRPVPQTAIEKFGKDWTKPENIVTSGAFKLKEFSPKNQIVVERNPQFWNNADTKLEKIIFISYDKVPAGSDYPEKASKRYENGETDAVMITSEPDESIKKRADFSRFKANGIEYLNLNTSIKPFNDIRVRRAFSMALNREKMKEKNLSQFPTDSFLPEIKGYENAGSGSYQPDEARRLLAEAGYPQGLNFPEIEYIYNTNERNRDIAEFVQKQWKDEINIKVKLVSMEFKEFLKKRSAFDYNGIARGAWVSDFNDPYNFLSSLYYFYTDKNGKITGWTDKKYGEVVEKSNLETDEAKRYKLLNEAETYLLEQQPVIPLAGSTGGFLCQPYVKNLSPNQSGFINWREVYIETE
ncbi:MAG: ABC transporter substrate-binding protein [Pyrinomonadaceae bacterium]